MIHTLTGQEEKVKTALEFQMESGPLKDRVLRILVPTEQVSEVKDGKRRITKRKFFPGYILVEMELSEETWYLVKRIPGVSKLIGAGGTPIPLRASEVDSIIKQTEEHKEKPTPKIIFEIGESVKIIDGPFSNFSGAIEEVNPDKGKLKVNVSIFGRGTPVELEYWQIERM